MSFGTETSFYSDLMSEWQDQGPNPDPHGTTTLTDGSLRVAVRCVCGICTLVAEDQLRKYRET